MGDAVYIATFRSRFAAFTIDSTILGFATALISIIYFDGNFFQLIWESPTTAREMAVVSFVEALYYVGLTAICGQTIGKYWVGIKVVDVRGQKASLLQCFVRYSPYMLLAIGATILLSRAGNAPDSWTQTVNGIKASIDHSSEVADMLGNVSQWTPDNLMQQDHPARALLRDWARESLISTLTIIWYFLSVIILWISRDNRTLHDYMAETVVLHKEPQG